VPSAFGGRQVGARHHLQHDLVPAYDAAAPCTDRPLLRPRETTLRLERGELGLASALDVDVGGGTAIWAGLVITIIRQVPASASLPAAASRGAWLATIAKTRAHATGRANDHWEWDGITAWVSRAEPVNEPERHGVRLADVAAVTVRRRPGRPAVELAADT
jgi:hypothetical protein